MKYGIYTSDGKRIATAEGDTLDTGPVATYVYKDGKTVASVSHESGCIVVQDQ